MAVSAPVLAVALYAGLNGLILFWLGLHVGNVRRRLRVSIGDGGRPELIRAMRGQANFVETVPYCLLLLVLLALLGAPLAVLHLLGAALTFGRIAHAAHFGRPDAPGWQRAAGAGLTFLVLAASSVWLTFKAIAGVL